MAQGIARTSYRFFITRPGNAEIGIILPAHRKYKVIPRHSPERYNTIEVNDDAEFRLEGTWRKGSHGAQASRFNTRTAC